MKNEKRQALAKQLEQLVIIQCTTENPNIHMSVSNVMVDLIEENREVCPQLYELSVKYNLEFDCDNLNNYCRQIDKFVEENI